MDRTIGKMLKLLPGLRLRFYVVFKSIIFPFGKMEDSVPNEGNIVEVGCSYGLTAVYLALKSSKRDIMGIDINKERIDCANRVWKKISNVRFRLGNLLDKVKKNQTVLAVDLLHHVPLEKQQQFFSDCYEKFDRTNILIIKEIDKRPFFKFLLNYVGDLLMNFGEFHFKSSKILKRELERIGFDVEYREIKHPLYPHYVLICRKR